MFRVEVLPGMGRGFLSSGASFWVCCFLVLFWWGLLSVVFVLPAEFCFGAAKW